jgi:hypothetical protein
LHQLDRMRTELPPDSELVGSKGFLVGSFPLVIETPSQIASQLTNARLLGLPADYLQRYRERLNAVTAVQARAAAQRVIKRQALTIVVVGDAEALYDKLSAIAPVRLVDVDGKPLSLGDLHPSAGVPVLDHAQLVARSDSFQALQEGRPIGYQTSSTVVTPDSIVLHTLLDLGGGALHRQSSIRFAPGDWSVTQVDESETLQGKVSETHLTYSGGRVKGRVVSPQKGGSPQTVDLDTTVAAGTYDERALHAIVPALALAPTAPVNLNVFSEKVGRTVVMQFKVSALDTVTVPAGKFVTYRVAVSGGQGPVVMDVTRDTPRRIVRIEFVGTPISFELVK